MLLFCLLLMKFNSVWGGATAREPSDPSRIPHTLLTGDIRFVRNFHSRFLAQDRDVVIYLPPGYDKNTWRRYAVLYMQDGQNLFDAATSFFAGAERHFDERAQALIAEQAIRPLIIVGVYSTWLNRINEYTPTQARGTHRGGEADLYGRMLVEELKPFIDSQYRTLPSKANTGLGGSSLGGLLAVYLGLKYSDTFSKLAVTSPACQWDDEMIVRYVRSLPRKSDQRIWLSVGTGESESPEAGKKAVILVTRRRPARNTIPAHGRQVSIPCLSSYSHANLQDVFIKHEPAGPSHGTAFPNQS